MRTLKLLSSNFFLRVVSREELVRFPVSKSKWIADYVKIVSGVRLPVGEVGVT